MRKTYFKFLIGFLLFAANCCSQEQLLPLKIESKSLIAFDHAGDDIWDHEIYVVDPETKKMQQLTDNSFIDEQPSWSPNGERIAYVSRRAGGFQRDDFMSNPLELVVSDLQTLQVNPVRRLLDRGSDSLIEKLAPIGVKISSNRSFYKGQLNPQWISDSVIGAQAHLPFGYLLYFPIQFELSTNLLKVCFDPKYNAEVHIKDVVWIDETHYYAILDPKANFLYDDPKYQLSLVLCHSDSGIVDTLFQNTMRFSNLCYNSFTKKLYFVSEDPKGPRPRDFVFSYDTDTNIKAKITRGFRPTISPGGSSMAFVRKVSEKSYAIFIRNLKSGDEEEVLEMPGYIGSLSWSKRMNKPE